MDEVGDVVEARESERAVPLLRGESCRPLKHINLEYAAVAVKRGVTDCVTHIAVQSLTVTALTLPRASAAPALAAATPRHMSDAERLSKLRHDLSNPLSALLAETQLLLLTEAQIDPATVSSLREIEALAIRMRAMLREM